MLHGTPLEERDPGATQPASGFRSAYGTASGAGVLLTTTLYDDTGSLGVPPLDRPGELEPVEIAGLAHDGIGELEGLEQLEATRTRSPTTSTAARGSTRGRSTRGPGRSRWSACSSARASSRAASCTASTTTRRAVASSRRSARRRARPSSICCLRTIPRRRQLTRERALGLAPSCSRRRGRVVRVARRAARLRAPLPAVSGARLRRAAPARLLRPRRPAEPGATRTSRGSRCR